jgi:hypothetical protein
MLWASKLSKHYLNKLENTSFSEKAMEICIKYRVAGCHTEAECEMNFVSDYKVWAYYYTVIEVIHNKWAYTALNYQMSCLKCVAYR